MPVADFEVRGSAELARLARGLKEAGNGGLQRELRRRIRAAVKPVIPDVRQSAYRTLPKRGGLAERVGKQAYGIRTALGSGASVRLAGRGMKELRDIDRGRLRHPVFGNRKVWKAQAVTPGFFSDAVERRAPKIRGEIAKAVGDVARQASRRF